MPDSKPPLRFMAESSKLSLESYELSRLNVAANLRRDLFDLVERWIEAEVEARLARWVLNHRRRDPKIRFDEVVALDALPEASKAKALPAASEARALLSEPKAKALPAPRPRKRAKLQPREAAVNAIAERSRDSHLACDERDSHLEWDARERKATRRSALDGLTSGPPHESPDAPLDGPTDGPPVALADGPTDGPHDERTDSPVHAPTIVFAQADSPFPSAAGRKSLAEHLPPAHLTRVMSLKIATATLSVATPRGGSPCPQLPAEIVASRFDSSSARARAREPSPERLARTRDAQGSAAGISSSDRDARESSPEFSSSDRDPFASLPAPPPPKIVRMPNVPSRANRFRDCHRRRDTA